MGIRIMAGRKTVAIPGRQFEVLGLLWEHGPMTVRELREHLTRGQEIPYTTVLGLLQTMERAGLVSHEKENPAHRYHPLISRREATGNLLGDFVQRFFRGSAERLVLSLVDTHQLSPEELREIETKLTKAYSKDSGPPRSTRPKRRRGKL
jgi:predicted transcriptional regulator